MSKDYTIEKLHKVYNVEKWKKALRIAEIRAEKHCTYEKAEKIYNAEQSKKGLYNKCWGNQVEPTKKN